MKHLLPYNKLFTALTIDMEKRLTLQQHREGDNDSCYIIIHNSLIPMQDGCCRIICLSFVHTHVGETTNKIMRKRLEGL